MQLDKTGNTANRPRQESSLVWRYGKLGPAKEAVKTLEEADYGHGVFRRTYEMEEMIEIEEESIRQRDVLGKKVLANNFDLMNPDGQIEEFGLLS
ncbi:MAG: hypothetical protein OXC57_07640 [Rhodobacteraceae bacterium]|nr:hypothetical protein [Paracoccaceae bacterium]